MKPSREFRAFFVVLCVMWTIVMFSVLMSCLEFGFVHGSDAESHLVTNFLTFIMILVGCASSTIIPLLKLWEYVTEKDKD